MIRPVCSFPTTSSRARPRPSPSSAPRPGLADDLLDTMRASSHSVGIAAPQIGSGNRPSPSTSPGTQGDSCHGELVLSTPRSAGPRARRGARGLHERARPDGRRGPHTPSSCVGQDPWRRAVLECNAFEARAVQQRGGPPARTAVPRPRVAAIACSAPRLPLVLHSRPCRSPTTTSTQRDVIPTCVPIGSAGPVRAALLRRCHRPRVIVQVDNDPVSIIPTADPGALGCSAPASPPGHTHFVLTSDG